MNVERLHNILFVLDSSVNEINLIKLIGELNTQLTNLSSDPNNADHQKNTAAAKSAVLDALSESNTTRFPNSWVEAVEAMGLECFLASEIVAEIEASYLGNDITPAAVQQRIEKLNKTLTNKKKVIEAFITSASNLEIGREELGDAESEITFEIPHEAIDSDAEKFADEVREFVRSFKPFYEMVDGSAAQIEVKSISSSRLTVTIKFAGAVTAVALAVSAVSDAVVDVIEAYESVQEFRGMKDQLQNQGKSAETAIKALEDLANQKMVEAIEKSVDSLWEEYGRPDETEPNVNDVKTRLRFGIRTMAEKLDHGYSVETRMGQLPEPETTENEDGDPVPVEDPDRSNLSKAFDKISSAHNRQLMFAGEGEPILHLPKIDDPEG